MGLGKTECGTGRGLRDHLVQFYDIIDGKRRTRIVKLLSQVSEDLGLEPRSPDIKPRVLSTTSHSLLSIMGFFSF